MDDNCIVLHSGGQDSTTCLLLAIDEFGIENVYTAHFLYNQSHVVEVEQAARICNALGIIEDHRRLFRLDVLADLAGGALTNKDITIGTDAKGSGNVYAEQHNLPSTVIPGRNALFLTTAIAWGSKFGCYTLMTGGCLADYEGYPDCRPEFYRAMEEALIYALDEPAVEILTPLTTRSKAETFALADELGYLDLIVRETHTCYRGAREWHDWGAGCGECPACETRAKGWEEYQASVTA